MDGKALFTLRKAFSTNFGQVEMIRKYAKGDLEAVLDIWLEASARAHDFVGREFWESRLDDMRTIYLPASENHVYEMDSGMVGFCSLHGDGLAALFVLPEHQGQGVGTALLDHAKARRPRLHLSVYKENRAACGFYLSQGFSVVREQPDEHTGHLEYTMVFPAE
jgi:putative acetyltransferase